jgi:hypothetical protein
MLLTCVPLSMTTVTFINRCGLVGDPHATPCCVLVGDPHGTPHRGWSVILTHLIVVGWPVILTRSLLAVGWSVILTCSKLYMGWLMTLKTLLLSQGPSRLLKLICLFLFALLFHTFGGQAKARYRLNTMESSSTPNSDFSPAHMAAVKVKYKAKSQANIYNCWIVSTCSPTTQKMLSLSSFMASALPEPPQRRILTKLSLPTLSPPRSLRHAYMTSTWRQNIRQGKPSVVAPNSLT